MNYCLVIPHFNHANNFSQLLPKLLQTKLPIIVVDDRSDNEQQQILEDLLASNTQIYYTKHTKNRGKGAAVITGAHFARRLGFSHIIQIDADGQHDISQLDEFIEKSQSTPEAIISGAPQFGADAPKARVYGRKITDFFVAIETLSLSIKDSLCGYRIYPLNAIEYILDRHYIGARMDCDTEILVKASWENIPILFLDTTVAYPSDGVSHFHYLRDNLTLIKLHTRLIIGMLIRAPKIIRNRFS